jgi:hypothetical protein
MSGYDTKVFVTGGLAKLKSLYTPEKSNRSNLILKLMIRKTYGLCLACLSAVCSYTVAPKPNAMNISGNSPHYGYRFLSGHTSNDNLNSGNSAGIKLGTTGKRYFWISADH